MQRIKHFHVLILLVLALTACAAPTPPPTVAATPTPIPTSTPLPTPTPIPSPTPTATPIPPMSLNVYPLNRVSALQPVFIKVELMPPPGVNVTATVSAVVRMPTDCTEQCDILPEWDTYTLQRQAGYVYAADKPLQVPLEPAEGDWQLIVRVEAPLAVQGKQELTFRPVPLLFRDLSGILHAGADLRVPQAFEQVVDQGDAWAGGRVWRYGGGQIELWWAPGPVEPLGFDLALAALQASSDPSQPPRIAGYRRTAWQNRPAFLFDEEWTAGQAETLVAQGTDYWLYVLRARALKGKTIPPLLRMVAETFTLQ